ncbi:MAG TPA: LysM peptidoglycan-binding domain-containing protein [Anaerolineales bacterium]
MSVVVISTPNADGDVMHDVLAGQTLWQIAVSYDVKIEDIKRLNNLIDDNIFPGERLLIKEE